MKRAFIVHGWDGSPQDHWYPWLRKKLETLGFKVIVPAMPETSEPNIEKWVSHLRKQVGTMDEETFFIGHSIGCQTIMRYLETQKERCGGAFFVAGWLKLDNLEDEGSREIAGPWLNMPINFNKVKEKIGALTVFLSSNEPFGYVEENAKLFREKLGAKVVLEKDKGHFTEDDGVREVPEVVDAIKRCM